MGMYSDVICNVCGWRFAINVGGGFEFYDLHCEVCGRHKRVEIEEIKDARLAFAKHQGWFPLYWKGELIDSYPGEPLTGEEYDRAVEDFAGVCECGGFFRHLAPVRCPKCRSTDLRQDPEGRSFLYD
jgi:hypothetical protein